MLLEEHPFVVRHPRLKVDVAALYKWYCEVVVPQPITLQGHEYGGWSVTSADGSLSEGWQTGQQAFKTVDGVTRVDETMNARMFTKGFSHRKPTPIFTDTIRELYAQLAGEGIHDLNRARVHKLPVGYAVAWHVDATEERWRLHVPIITNAKSLVHYRAGEQTQSLHMPADGSVYLIRVDKLHSVSNGGTEPRIHLVAQPPNNFTSKDFT